MEDTGKYGFPLKPCDPGKPATQAMSEAYDRQERHDEFHRCHPGEPCPDSYWQESSHDYDNIARDRKLMDPGGQTFEPGDGMAYTRK
jgi:hypothetical protein